MDEVNEKTETQSPAFIWREHPWLELNDSTLDEDIRYTLDEIRFA